MRKDLIKKPAKWFALETLGNFLFEQIGALWRSAVVAAIAAIAWRFYADTPPDVRLIVLLFLVAFIFIAIDRIISRRRARRLNLEAAKATPGENKEVDANKEGDANCIQMGVLQCGVRDADTGEDIRGATCVALCEQTKQEYMGDTDGLGVVRLRVPVGFYVVKIKAPQYGTRVEAAHLAGERAIATIDADLTKIQEGKTSKETCADKWLHEIAEQDRDDLSKSVRIVRCEVQGWTINSEQPHALFDITVFNGSVFNIAIDRNVSGYISYGDDGNGYQRLRGEMMMTGRHRVTECRRYYYLRLEIQQWLTPDDLNVLAKANESGRFNFQLRDLIINVIGGPGTSGVRPSPLSFHNFELVRFP